MTVHQKSSTQTQEAVVFFHDSQIVCEMLYTEFEALLDCVVPIRDFVGTTLEAVYVRLDARLVPQTAVFFLIPFDAEGFPDRSWDVPLRMLAERGVSIGPDLGAGPVRLVTRSQCPLAEQADKLWDMRFDPAGNTLDVLRERVQMNRLGLDVSDPAPPPAPPPRVDVAPVMAAPVQGGSEVLLTLLQQSNEQLETLREQTRRDVMTLQRELTGAREQVRKLETERQALRERLATEQKVFEQQKGSLQEELRQHTGQARTAIEAARRAAECERDAALAERDARMHEELARLEQERALQEEQLLSLRSELTELRRDKLRLMGEGADKFFAALKEKGVKFVAYQPGAGHITIPMEELRIYLGDTEAYVAAKCGVSLDHYRRWLAHYHEPVCQGAGGDGGPCAKPVQKLLKPVEFMAGLHDRCEIHKQFAQR